MSGTSPNPLNVTWTGIRGSGLHAYVAGPICVPVQAEHSLSHGKALIVMGHGYCGAVTEPRHGVEGLAVGGRVVIELILNRPRVQGPAL